MKNLHVDSVIKYYGKKRILNSIHLSCKKGEIVALVGKNGSGKSTLLKILFGVESASQKFIKIEGYIVRGNKNLKKHINYLPQENFLPLNIKIKTIIQLFLPKEKSDALFHNEYIVPLLQKQFQELSGGEKRILELLLILNSEKRYVLLDEPFNGVSPITKEYILKYLSKNRAKKGYIITDHDFENVFRIADKIVLLDCGNTIEIKDYRQLVNLGYLSETNYQQIMKGQS
ncbi:ATP-binding cassette domain-containing protein [Maribacter cobaltidurans]|uniref:Uncharacterized protein n=1 Tax=Maribacter cobaltidurans TaxID=1178778 RepID=A0A223V8K3_9FLAO|nr:ATP-binding cassette domain-containing protein [Maribacter cobaltidurans]ASV31735.1 hypothetical protein CJ263_16775 [Maribacter cobaltidurans]GGD93452.1 ABC transporter ATP-binding protein [Maribacter cobaltidurans]